MQAIYSLHLNIKGSYDITYVYVCEEHNREYTRDMEPWIVRRRLVSSLHVECNRCRNMQATHSAITQAQASKE